MKYKTILDVNKAKPDRSKLTAIEFLPPTKFKKTTYRMVLCKCECGNIKELPLGKFLSKRMLSCNCSRWDKEHRRGVGVKYTHHIPRLYNIYYHMIRRCYDSTEVGYDNYGGRGVMVCDEWRGNYQSFLDWSLKNGYADNLVIDKDIRGDGLLYSPDTCSWVTQLDNNNAKKSYPRFEYNGNQLTIPQIARAAKVSKSSLYRYVITKGYSVPDAIFFI